MSFEIDDEDEFDNNTIQEKNVSDEDDEFDNNPIIPNEFQENEQQISEIPNINPISPRNKTTQNYKKKFNLDDPSFFENITNNLKMEMEKKCVIKSEMNNFLKKKRSKKIKKSLQINNNTLSKKSTKNVNSDEQNKKI